MPPAKSLAFAAACCTTAAPYVPWGIIMPYIAAVTVPGPYVVPAYRLETIVVLTNKVPTTPVRGAGRPQAVFAMERLLDRVARELSLDRAEVRRRNFIQPEQMPYAVGLLFRDGKPLVYDSGDYPKGQDEALRLAGYEGFRERQRAALEQGRLIGIGIGNYVEGTGLGPFEGVTVRVLPSGKVAVATGATNQGQGTRTTLSQIVAEQVGCRIEDIVMTDRRYRRNRPRRRRFRQPPGGECRLLSAARRRSGAQADHRAGGARARRRRRRYRSRRRPGGRDDRQ